LVLNARVTSHEESYMIWLGDTFRPGRTVINPTQLN